MPGVDRYVIQISRDRAFPSAATVELVHAAKPTLRMLDEPLDTGEWFWRWSDGRQWSQTFAFTILPDAVETRIGSAADLAARMGPHPRAMVPVGGVDALRQRLASEKSAELAAVRRDADSLLALAHDMPEPPFLPDARGHDYNKVHVVWRKAMEDARAFCTGTERLAFAYLITGDIRFADAAAARLDSLARWNPDGSTSIPHNDEPHMAVMDGAIIAFDWVADRLEGERLSRIVAHLSRRSENTYRWLLEKKNYGIDSFASHSGRMLGFLGQSGISLMGHDAGAATWLRYTLERLVAMYPVWGQEDGGWGEGFSYCSAYMRWILQFLYSAKTSLGIDLYAKPFFRNHARWWAMACPYYACQTPFGDGSDRAIPSGSAAVITQHLGRLVGDMAAVEYGRRCRNRAAGNPGSHTVSTGNANLAMSPTDIDPLLLLSDTSTADRAGPLPRAEAFRGVGYVAMRSSPERADEDIALVFKSGPYGPVSHSHADQNCFVLSAYGEPLLIRTGYYTGYDNPHHHNWIRQTRAHNGVTASGVGQWVFNPASVGWIAGFKRSRRFAYCCGDASHAYGDRLSRFRRHVLFVGYRYFLIVDDLAAPFETTFEFHLHALEPIRADEAARTARIVRGGAALDVRFVCPKDMRLYEREGFDPPLDDPGVTGLPTQYHLRAATVPPWTLLRSAMLLIPQRVSAPESFQVDVAGDARGLRVVHGAGADEFLVGEGSALKTPVLQWRRDGKTLLEVR